MGTKTKNQTTAAVDFTAIQTLSGMTCIIPTEWLHAIALTTELRFTFKTGTPANQAAIVAHSPNKTLCSWVYTDKLTQETHDVMNVDGQTADLYRQACTPMNAKQIVGAIKTWLKSKAAMAVIAQG